MDSYDDGSKPHYLFYFIPAYLMVVWLLLLQPLLFLVWVFVICPILACMSFFCRPRLKKVYKYIDKIVKQVFRFVESREVKDDDGIKIPRFVVFGYLAPPVFTFYLFFLCLVTACFTLAGFFNSFLIDVSDICSPYDEYQCFTLEGEPVSKPIERPTNSSELTCFNQTDVNCFMFVYDTETGIAHAAALLTFSWIIILVMLWLLLKCSGGQGSGCYLPCLAQRRCWCSCGLRCIITVLFQAFVLFVPQLLLLSPFFNEYVASLFKNYLNLDTTGQFFSSDSLKLLHISAMLMYGVFVPWCWFKKVPTKDEDSSDKAKREQEAGDENHEPTQVHVSITRPVAEPTEIEMHLL